MMTNLRIGAQILFACSIALQSTIAQATFMFFTDRTSWDTAVLSAGLSITTEDFNTEPSGFPTIDVGGVDFEFSAFVGSDPVTVTGGVVRGPDSNSLSMDFLGGEALFGYGFDFGESSANITVTDILGATGNDSNFVEGFLGVLSTVALSPANIGFGGAEETDVFRFNQTGSFAYIDNLSVATAVPEPTTLALFSLGLAGLGFVRRRKA